MIARLDRALGRLTMYRLVTVCLSVLAVVSLVYAATGVLEPVIFPVGWMAATLATLIVACVVSNAAFAALVRVRPHHESAVITAMLLWFLFWPAQDTTTLAWLLVPAVAAMASKYLLAWRGRHLFNPAAAGVVISVIIQHLADQTRVFSTWWVASEPLLGWVVLAALVVWRRTTKTTLGLVFTLLAVIGLVIGLHDFGSTIPEALRTAVTSYPVVFAAAFMLTEPLTLPPRRWQQLVAAAVAAVLFVWGPLTGALLGHTPELWIFTGTQEIALLAANLAAFGFRVKASPRLELVSSHRVGDLLVSDFATRPGFSFTPGQYAEIQVDHRRPDLRGTRRMLSIASPPDADLVRFAVRLPPEPSSYKRALAELRPGDRVRATMVAGDFVLPPAEVPLLLVAGGIGITPFLAQVDQLVERDAVLVYGLRPNPSGVTSVPFAEELSGVRVVLVVPGAISDEIPAHWRHLDADRIGPDLIAGQVTDVARRTAFVSGSPMMVDTVAAGLRGQVKRVHTDLFSGY